MYAEHKAAIDSPEGVKYVFEKAKKTGIDVFPIACVTKGMKGQELCDYDALKAAGVTAISDDGRPVENAELMRQAIEKTNENGLIVTSHCEDFEDNKRWYHQQRRDIRKAWSKGNG